MMDYLQPNDNAIEKILQSPIDGSLELVNVRIPSLIAFFPDTAIQSESAIIIACGGGFHSTLTNQTSIPSQYLRISLRQFGIVGL